MWIIVFIYMYLHKLTIHGTELDTKGSEATKGLDLELNNKHYGNAPDILRQKEVLV